MLFGMTDEELHVREIERRSGFAVGTIQTELRKLSRLDLVVKHRDGNRLYYRANKSHPLFADIHNLVLKTTGLVDVIRNALAPQLDSTIQMAFIFGSVADQTENAASDVDLMIIGSLGLRSLTRHLSGVADRVGREINPYVLTIDEFIKRKTSGEHFITSVLKQPKLFISGNEDDLIAMV